MAGWGDGEWGALQWGGGEISQYIKVIYIKIKNYIESVIRIK